MKPMIKGLLHKTYGDDMHVVFRRAQIEILPDEIYLLVGRNGIGKSTLLKICAQIENNHRDTLDFDVTKHEISYMPSQLAYYAYMSVNKLLEFHQESSKRFSIDHARMYLDNFNIDQKKKVEHLSDGQKKILSYIIALSYQAKLYLIDEPFPNVDLVFDETFRKMILKNKNECNTFVISTHQVSEFEKIASKLVFIKSKKEIEIVDVEQVRLEYNESIESYIKSEMKRIAYEN
jgi:ABC-2 type transport system ATP-binding protein